MSPIFRTLAAVCSTALITVVTVGVPASPAWASTPCFTVTDNVVSDGGDCTGVVTLPDGVTSIANNAFNRSNLTSIVIPNTVTSIGNGAFNRSNLTSIVIPKSVTSIGNGSFQTTAALTSVTFKAGSELTTIANDAFFRSGLTSIVIPKSVTSIAKDAFYETSALTLVTFEAGSELTTIADGAFDGSLLTSIVIPKSVTSIGSDAFATTFQGLTSVTFEGNAPSSVGTSAFSGVANGRTANIGFTATGFEPDGDGLWEGLVLVRAAAPPVPAVASGPAGPALACMPAGPPAVGALVTCTVTGGDAGIDILWRAAYNPVFAGEGMTLDASGAGTFSFVVPAAAFGQPITVELVDWIAPVSLGVSGGPVPTSVPAGGGPVPVWTASLAALAGVGLLRRGMRAQA